MPPLQATVVKHLSASETLCKIHNAKKLGELKLVDLPNKRLNLPFLSETDKWVMGWGQ